MKIEEKIIYFGLFIAFIFIIILDSSFELSKKVPEEELRIVRPIAVTNIVLSTLFLLFISGIYFYHNQ